MQDIRPLPVAVTDDRIDGPDSVLARFATIAEAVTYLETSPEIDLAAHEAGDYAISAPHGLGDDSEAPGLATRLGFQLVRSLSAPRTHAYKAPGSRERVTGFASREAAALSALATIDPDDIGPTGDAAQILRQLQGPTYDAVLAALRLLATGLDAGTVAPDDGAVGDILTNSGAHPGLTADEIHDIADRMNNA